MRSLSASFIFLATTALSATGDPLPRSTPEAQGIPSSAILAFVDAAERELDSLHSLMVLRHGHVVAEGWWRPYEREDPHTLWSLSKSFASTGIGLAVAEGRLGVDDPVLGFFPEEAPAEPGDHLKAMRVRDLLAMATGQHGEDIDRFSFRREDVPLARAFLAMPVPHKPGTHFHYNTPATYMLSAIVQKATGVTLLEYLRPRLFEPLGIRNPTWAADPRGVTLGGFGLSITTEDVARFGQLYLQEGVWGGKRVLPAEWVAAATARQSSNGSDPKSDWEQGYGYQFWRCRHGVYRGDGAFGQFCVVMPEKNAVVVMTSGVRDMQAVLNLVWDHLLAGMQPASLPPDRAGHARLQRRLGDLSIPPQAGEPTSPLAAEISGRLYVFPENDGPFEALGLEVGAETTLLVSSGGRELRLPCGFGEWRRGGRLRVDGVEQPVAVSGAWTAGHRFTAKACLYETSFCSSLDLRFAGDELLFDQEMNVAFGPRKRPQLVGRHRDEVRAPAAGAR